MGRRAGAPFFIEIQVNDLLSLPFLIGIIPVRFRRDHGVPCGCCCFLKIRVIFIPQVLIRIPFIDKSKDELYKQKNTDELYNYYKTKEFICDDTPLWRVVEMLNEVYHSHIIIGNNNIVDLPLSTTLPADSLNEALNVISQTFNIHVEKNGNNIILK